MEVVAIEPQFQNETVNHTVHKLRHLREELVRRGFPVKPFTLRLFGDPAQQMGYGEPAFALHIKSRRGLRALLSLEELRIAEAYMDGHLDIEGSMLEAIRYRALIRSSRPLHYVLQTYLKPLIVGQVAHDVRAIPAHYDNDAEFFCLWLDKLHYAYSHGFFASDDEPIEAGMRRKYEFAWSACDIQPGQTVLDIGGGWGAFLRFAGERGVKVTSLTISSESEAFMNRLIRQHRLPCTVVRQHFMQYRRDQRFDAIVNFGVTEHLPDYAGTIRNYTRLLKPGRKLYLDAYSGRRFRMPPFVSKWVFPGNTSPLSLKHYLAELDRGGFETLLVQDDRHNYELSCRKWAENLEAVEREVVDRWGEHLFRLFRMYLWSATLSFETGRLGAHRLVARYLG